MTDFKTSLHNEFTFYPNFIKDLEDCQKEVIIESSISYYFTLAFIIGYIANKYDIPKKL